MIAPTLRTERLTLRPMRLADYPAYRAMMMSERAVYVGGPHDATTAWLCFCHDVACWTLFGHGALMIDVTATGECVGQVGVNGGPLFPEKELGWLVYEGAEGRGYITEAAAAMRDWAFGALGVDSLVSYIDPGNDRSMAVAERLGALRDQAAATQDGDPDDVVYRHYRPG